MKFRSCWFVASDTPCTSPSKAGVARLRAVPRTRNAMLAAPVRVRSDGLGPGRRSDGVYPSFSIALRTDSAVSGATRGWLLMTRDTVELETPASLATRVMDMVELRPLSASESAASINSAEFPRRFSLWSRTLRRRVMQIRELSASGRRSALASGTRAASRPPRRTRRRLRHHDRLEDHRAVARQDDLSAHPLPTQHIAKCARTEV